MMVLQSLADINWAELKSRKYTKSPTAWEDMVLYFMLLDRFSDNKEKDYHDSNGKHVNRGKTPLYHESDLDNAVRDEESARRWRDAGVNWIGGNFKGAASKLGYLKRLGVTTLWISPVFKQAKYQQNTYHGYAIQDFLDVDPHLGTREDLKKLVDKAHKMGMYVVLDIIFNHAGNVFGYDQNDVSRELGSLYQSDKVYAVQGFRDEHGDANLPFGPIDLQQFPQAWPDGAIWPRELQSPDTFTRKGYIRNWDNTMEFNDGDFFDLKDIELGSGDVDYFQPSNALRTLVEIYKFWIAYADVDGYRIDTVKHMDPGAVRFFASSIHEFAQSIGKENFYLIGEITGGNKKAYEVLAQTGLDAALGINDIPDKLEYTIKGLTNPQEYFGLFRNSLLEQTHEQAWFRNKVVAMYDDHDQVRRGNYKARFAAGDNRWGKLALGAIAFNMTTMCIPCIYYGSEQGFDGQGDSEKYVREAMFGGDFGAFRTRNRHFFNENHPIYTEVAKILSIRKQKIALRRGRQYLREISGDGITFGYPHTVGGTLHSLVAWSRIFDSQSLLVLINTDSENVSRAWVTIDNFLFHEGQKLRCIYSTDSEQINSEFAVERRSDRDCVHITIPAAGFMIVE